MLPAAHRLRRSTDFGRTVREGVRAGRSTMVVHHLAPGEHDGPAMVGFVVSKAVGNAVARNLVKRRMRALMGQRTDQLPRGTTTVIRALPPSAGSTYAALARDLDRCLDRIAGRGAGARP